MSGEQGRMPNPMVGLKLRWCPATSEQVLKVGGELGRTHSEAQMTIPRFALHLRWCPATSGTGVES